MYQVVLEYDDGRKAVVERTVDEMADAIVFAIDLADRAGHYHGDGHGRPRWVKIFDGSHMEIAISVIPNGLLSSIGARQSRST